MSDQYDEMRKSIKEFLDEEIEPEWELSHRQNFHDVITQHWPKTSGSSAAELVVNQGLEHLITLFAIRQRKKDAEKVRTITKRWNGIEASDDAIEFIAKDIETGE